MKIIVEKNKIVINSIAIRIAGKVSRYIDASMNRATPNNCMLNASNYYITIHTI